MKICKLERVLECNGRLIVSKLERPVRRQIAEIAKTCKLNLPGFPGFLIVKSEEKHDA